MTFGETEIASLLVERGVPAAKAKRAAHAAVGFHDKEADSSIPSPLDATKRPTPTRTRNARESGKTPPCTTGKRHRSEASVQREIVNALRAAGWRVWRIGQRDARKTQDAGVPDLFAMRPWVIGWVMPLATWIECKRADGKQSEAQKDFERRCEHAGQRYVVARSLDDIKELL